VKNEEILKKAIEKAVKNGYEFNDTWLNEGSFKITHDLENVVKFILGVKYRCFQTIFSHDFAKAFWGPPFTKGEWGHHLQQMVLQEEPLKYLEKFL